MKQSFITKFYLTSIQLTAWKVSKYGVISGPITGKYGPEITPYLVAVLQKSLFLHSSS